MSHSTAYIPPKNAVVKISFFLCLLMQFHSLVNIMNNLKDSTEHQQKLIELDHVSRVRSREKWARGASPYAKTVEEKY